MTFLLAFIIWRIGFLSEAPGFNDPKGSIGVVVRSKPWRPYGEDPDEDDFTVGQSGALDIDKPQILTIMRDWTKGLSSCICLAVCCAVSPHAALPGLPN